MNGDAKDIYDLINKNHKETQEAVNKIGTDVAVIKTEQAGIKELVNHVRGKINIHLENYKNEKVIDEKEKNKLAKECKDHTNKMFWGLFIVFTTISSLIVSIIKLVH